MNLWTRIALCLALATGVGLLATPSYHALRIYHLSYDGPVCTDTRQHDCLQTVEAKVSNKKTENASDGTGSTTNYYLLTNRGRHAVEEDMYNSVHKNDRVWITSLNGKYAFVSYKGVRDSTGGSQQDSAVMWAVAIGALLMALSAAVVELFFPDAEGITLLAILISPATAFFGTIPVFLFSAFWDLKGIIISWIAAAITGACVAIKANY